MNSSSTILYGFLDAYKSSKGYSAAHGMPTLHQKALFTCWVSILFLSLIRSITKHLLPGRLHLIRVGILSSPASVSRNVVEQIEEGNRANEGSNKTRNSAERSKAETVSFDAFAHAVIILGLIMYFFYMCDYIHVFPKANRTYSRDLFIVLSLLLLVVGAGLTCMENNAKLLNRDQTEEWKGWMQVMFVWYHYFKAAEIYNSIRLFIAAYVWMTGFGNFSFFWVRRDYSIYRILKMLFRLNFLVVVATIVTNNQYMLYYICAMHTFWFISVYAMMRPYEHLNEHKKVMLFKFSIYAIVIFAIYELGAASFVFAPFKFILALNGELHEWKFRSGLDHYATLFGMICAYSHPNFECLMAYLESESQTFRDRLSKNSVRIGIGAVLIAVMIIWYVNVYSLGKYDYNRLHPYTSIIPILAYIYFRNVVPAFRSRHAFLFTWLGKITLETYIAQLHIYMQGNAKELIVYIENYPLLNFVLATFIYLFMSYFLFNVTVTVSGYLLPREMVLLLKRVGVVALWILASYTVTILASPQTFLEVVGYIRT